jgi:CheY-like chemotaxis protein
MLSALRVLIVEDSPGDPALLRRYLTKAFGAVEIAHVERIVQAFELLKLDTPDVVLLDLSLPTVTASRPATTSGSGGPTCRSS